MAQQSSCAEMTSERPGKPSLEFIENNQVLVKWKPPTNSLTKENKYQLAYKESNKRLFKKIPDITSNEIIIPKLKSNVEYKFKLRVLNLDDDEISEWTEEAKIKIEDSRDENRSSSDNAEYTDAFDPSKRQDIQSFPSFCINGAIPGAPTLLQLEGCHTMSLTWPGPSEYRNKIDCYELYSKEGENKPVCVRTQDDSNTFALEHLKQDCTYTFRVRVVTHTDYADTFSDMSAESAKFKTPVSIASHLIHDQETQRLSKDTYTNMTLYKLKCHNVGEIDNVNKVRQVVVGHGRDLSDECIKRYVLLFGKAGAGKSTIIDLIANHVYDVAWEDDFRLTAVDKTLDESNREEHMTQTQWITCYEFRRKENSMLSYDLVIIDTPGFTPGNNFETQKIKKQYQTLFESKRIPGLHAVCFVSQSHTGRLSENERMLSETLSQLFGKDIEENIFIFATCADSTSPVIKMLLRKIGLKYHKCFKFNNTPFTLEHQMSRADDQRRDWESGKTEIFDFFTTLEDLHFSSCEAFEGQAKLCEEYSFKYKAKHREIEDACCTLINILNKHMQYEKRKVKHPRGRYSTVCNKCRRTCCTPCLASMVYKGLCWNIRFFSGKCVGCLDSCTLRDHEYGKYYFIQVPVNRSQPKVEELFDQDCITKNSKDIKSKGKHISDLLTDATDIHNKLQKEMGFGNAYSEKEMIDYFIREKKSNEIVTPRFYEAIFEKCKKDLNLKKGDRWKQLDDFTL